MLWWVHNLYESIFNHENVRRCSFFNFFKKNHQNYKILPQKVHLSQHAASLWSAWKIFSKDITCPQLCLESSLESYLSTELSSMIIRHANPFLWDKTWSDIHFWCLKVSLGAVKAFSKENERFWAPSQDDNRSKILITERLTASIPSK